MTGPREPAPAAPHVRSVLWRAEGDPVEGLPAVQLAARLGGRPAAEAGEMFWIDVVRPDVTVMAMLADALGLDDNSVEDAVAAGERPKATRHAGYLFVSVYATAIDDAPDSDAGGEPGDGVGTRLRADRVSAFVFPSGVLTVRGGRSSGGPSGGSGFDIDGAVARWRRETRGVGGGPYALLHAVLDAVVDGQLDTAERFDDMLESIEDRLFDAHPHGREVQRTNYRLRKDLVHFRRLILPMRDVVTLVIRHHTDDGAPGMSRELRGDYADLYDHVLRVAELSESLRELVTTIFETNLSLQDARLNTVMKKLTGWAGIIAVPTAITGWFGQNLPFPGYDSHAGFVASTVVILVFAVGLFVLFRSKDWI